MTKLNTKSNEVLISDLLLESFDYGEVEGMETQKKYSGPASNDTDTGQDNPYWNLSILLRIGSYCATAQRQLAKANERADTLADKISQSPSDNLMNAMEQNESAIVNCEKEYLILKNKARKTGRSISEQETFEHSVDMFLADNGGKGLHKDICSMPKDKAQGLLNDAVKTSAKKVA